MKQENSEIGKKVLDQSWKNMWTPKKRELEITNVSNF